MSFATIILLRAPSEAAGEVFFASLRRAGERDVEPVRDRPGGEHVEFRAGALELGLVSVASPVSREQLDYAAAQSWNWSEAAETVAGHAAHITVTTRGPAETAPAQIVRLHHRAHAALAEFTPVLAVLWPGAARLVPADALSALSRQASDAPPAAASCVNFRVFPPENPEAGGFVSDTVGLHAFGLPDIQMASEDEPDERVSAVLYDLAERLFAGGCEIAEGETICLDGRTQWRAERTTARFPPERGVVQLTRISG